VGAHCNALLCTVHCWPLTRADARCNGCTCELLRYALFCTGHGGCESNVFMFLFDVYPMCCTLDSGNMLPHTAVFSNREILSIHVCHSHDLLQVWPTVQAKPNLPAVGNFGVLVVDGDLRTPAATHYSSCYTNIMLPPGPSMY
jgi:hypothetical protein